MHKVGRPEGKLLEVLVICIYLWWLTALLSCQVCESVIPSESSIPHVNILRERVEFVGKNHDNNVSILLYNITFEDGGQYTCYGRNPKEHNKNHSAIFNLIVVDESE